MIDRPDTSPGSALLVGEATEDWAGDAVFYEYSAAVDPLAAGAISPIPVHRFSPGLHAGDTTRAVPLDLSGRLGIPYPATSPGLLASFVVIGAGDALRTEDASTSELFYCLRGRGSTQLHRSPARAAPRSITWEEGDVWTLPGGHAAVHTADRSAPAGALLYRVSDDPLLRYLGVAPTGERFAPTWFDGAEARSRLAEVARDPAAAGRSRVSVLLGNAATPQTLTVTHTLWAMIGVLPAGRVQRPHRHQSVALDLITACSPGCYSLIGSRLDGAGVIVEPQRVDWEPAGVFVTPPGLWHSHHNESGRAAYLFPVQDAGLHTYLRSLDIRFTPTGE